MLSRNQFLHQRYRIIRALGKGGFGQVYEALDDKLDCIVAIKERLAKLDSQKMRHAFEKEAKLLAGLRHPVLPKVMDHFFVGEGQYLVMEFIEGDDLAHLLSKWKQPFTVEQVLTWADELLKVLVYLHSRPEGILHRDIKPANIKLTNEGDIFLLDFGLAKGYAGEMLVPETSQRSSSVHGYTAAYAPLEQLNNSGTNEQSDLYALGATLFHLLTGRAPVSAAQRYKNMEMDGRDPLLPAHEIYAAVPQPVSLVLSQAMAMSRRERLRSATDMRQAFIDARREIAETDTQTYSSSSIQPSQRSGSTPFRTLTPTAIAPTAPTPGKESQPGNEASWPSPFSSEAGDSSWASTVVESELHDEDETAPADEEARQKAAEAIESKKREEELERLRLEEAEQKEIEEKHRLEEAEEKRRALAEQERMKAEEDKRMKRLAEEEAARRAAEERRIQEQKERERLKAEEVARRLEQERKAAQLLAEQEERRRAEVEASKKADEEARKREEEPKRQAEAARQLRLKEEEVKKAQEEARRRTEEERQRAEAEAQRRDEDVAKQKAAEVERLRATPRPGEERTMVVEPKIYRPLPEPQSMPSPQFKYKFIIGASVVAFMLLGAAILGYFYLKDSGTSQTTQTNQTNNNSQTASDSPTPQGFSLKQSIGGQGGTVWSVAFAPVGSVAASAGDSKIVRVWDTNTWQLEYDLKGHSDIINSVAFSPDGQLIASGSKDKNILIWNVFDGSPRRTLSGHRDQVLFVAFSPDGQILASASADRTIRLWSVVGNDVTTLSGHTDEVWSIAFSPDGKTLASAGRDGTIRIWDVVAGSQKSEIPAVGVYSLAFSLDGDTLASGHGDNTVKLWKLTTLKEIMTLRGHTKYINYLAFTPDGKTLASASDDGTIMLWDVSNGKNKQTLQDKVNKSVKTLSFSPDGKTLLSGGKSQSLTLWQASQ